MFLKASRRGALCALAIATTLCGTAALADPPERGSNATDRERVSLTIYNGGNSLVHDRRRVALRAGENGIAWRDVSGQIDATSALLSDLSLPGGASVVEQNFDFDLLKPSALLEKYVGHDVTVVHDAPLPGQPARETATLLADNEGVVLQYRDRIETDLNGSHIVFPRLPSNLRDRPTLVLDLIATKTATQTLDLAYLTEGLGWSADYVGSITPDERFLNIGGLITLTNTTGTTFSNARVQLVAGNSVSQENFFEYHLYTLARPTTVANAQTKQVSLLSAKHVPVRKTLELRGSGSYYYNKDADLGTKLKIGVYLTFTNKGGDLGVALPGGTFRIYKTDSHGMSQFAGSDSIDHTPRDQDVRLHLGDSFDVTATKKQTDFAGLGHCTYESSYEVAVSNAKDVAQDVLVVESIPGTWSISSENVRHEKSSSATSTWHLRVGARSTTTLKYRAHVSFCF